eukprot:7382709-Prymnesium_polylepis.2
MPSSRGMGSVKLRGREAQSAGCGARRAARGGRAPQDKGWTPSEELLGACLALLEEAACKCMLRADQLQHERATDVLEVGQLEGGGLLTLALVNLERQGLLAEARRGVAKACEQGVGDGRIAHTGDAYLSGTLRALLLHGLRRNLVAEVVHCALEVGRDVATSAKVSDERVVEDVLGRLAGVVDVVPARPARPEHGTVACGQLRLDAGDPVRFFWIPRLEPAIRLQTGKWGLRRNGSYVSLSLSGGHWWVVVESHAACRREV